MAENAESSAQAALLRYVLRLTQGDMPFAEDVVRESLLQLRRKPEMLERPAQHVRAWLFTVARNLVIDDSNNAIGPAFDKWILSDALLSLSADHRTAIVRAYYLGQTVADIAAYEGIPAGTVKSRLHYAVRALRIALQERGVAR
jgi:RNA polymerase sigma-70 factor (ECF subfamily)